MKLPIHITRINIEKTIDNEVMKYIDLMSIGVIKNKNTVKVPIPITKKRLFKGDVLFTDTQFYIIIDNVELFYRNLIRYVNEFIFEQNKKDKLIVTYMSIIARKHADCKTFDLDFYFCVC